MRTWCRWSCLGILALAVFGSACTPPVNRSKLISGTFVGSKGDKRIAIIFREDGTAHYDDGTPRSPSQADAKYAYLDHDIELDFRDGSKRHFSLADDGKMTAKDADLADLTLTAQSENEPPPSGDSGGGAPAQPSGGQE